MIEINFLEDIPIEALKLMKAGKEVMGGYRPIIKNLRMKNWRLELGEVPFAIIHQTLDNRWKVSKNGKRYINRILSEEIDPEIIISGIKGIIKKNLLNLFVKLRSEYPIDFANSKEYYEDYINYNIKKILRKF